MRRLILVVEGQTEEAFVNQLLAPALAEHALYATATRITTSRNAHHVYKGGFVNFAHVERDISLLLKSDSRRYVGTMVDLYRLPNTVPGYATASEKPDPYAKISTLEAEWFNHFGSSRFVPLIQLHEFEALLFSDANGAVQSTGFAGLGIAMSAALAEAQDNPELVNQTPTGAPSKRIAAAYPAYQKVVHGIQIAQHIGLPAMLQRCTHFSQWYARLLKLPQL